MTDDTKLAALWAENDMRLDRAPAQGSMLGDEPAAPVRQRLDVLPVSVVDITKIKILIPQAVRLGYTVKVHEILLVFRKPLA